mgnify:CR=1 FL=1
MLQDVPPFVTAAGYPATPRGIEQPKACAGAASRRTDILAIRRAYKTLYREGRTLDDARQRWPRRRRSSPSLAPLVEFLADARSRHHPLS